MPLETKLALVLESLRSTHIESLTPALRRQIRDTCRFVADKVDPDAPRAPRTGVLADLRKGRTD